MNNVLAEVPVGGTADLERNSDLKKLLSGMESFVSWVLREVHLEWHDESLDGIFPVIVRKTSKRELIIFGLCVLVPDQDWLPIYLLVRSDASKLEIASLECKIGDNDIRQTARRPNNLWKRCYLLKEEPDKIDWKFHVKYGD